ncbi:trichohyalin [Lingula anatina]|uniref:Trichohyalin n=1 Tax=Lingula anatina TaxID=7574 RepID=A0A1S3J1B7_LINAN|nr:trichohyalin [Lingula anatina]|eukprot:XP_013404051.1 trichohyalin [Lingula anatina]
MGELGFTEDQMKVIDDIFMMFDTDRTGELTPLQLQSMHQEIRMGGISFPQVLASIKYVCASATVDPSEMYDVLLEMDRRYYLVQELRWEFAMLDRQQRDTITEEQAKWFMQSIHGKSFSRRKWDKFIKTRPVPGSGVSFAEIEVELCNIPNRLEVEIELKEEEKDMEEQMKKKLERERLQREEEERLRKEKEEQKKRRLEEQAKRKKLEEEERLRRQKEEDELRKKRLLEEERQEQERNKKAEEEDEELKRRQEEEEEARRLREHEERMRLQQKESQDSESKAKEAKQREKEAEEEINKARQKRENAKDDKARKEAEELEKEAQRRKDDERNKRIRLTLKAAISSRDRTKIEPAVKEFEKAKLSDDDEDLPKARRILEELDARDGLRNAMVKRNLEGLEKAINNVKRKGFEVALAPEMAEANKLLLQLRRLERIRAEILQLKQSTVAEIRSYSSPPTVVHTVMIGTFLLHGHTEKETKIWKNVQALVGKTGKDGLKRRCLEYDPDKLANNMQIAKRAKELMKQHELDEVRDVSAGAATFYVWGLSMIEEAEARIEARKYEAENPAPEPSSGSRGASPTGAGGRSKSKSPARKELSLKTSVMHGKIKVVM